MQQKFSIYEESKSLTLLAILVYKIWIVFMNAFSYLAVFCKNTHIFNKDLDILGLMPIL